MGCPKLHLQFHKEYDYCDIRSGVVYLFMSFDSLDKASQNVAVRKIFEGELPPAQADLHCEVDLKVREGRVTKYCLRRSEIPLLQPMANKKSNDRALLTFIGAGIGKAVFLGVALLGFVGLISVSSVLTPSWSVSPRDLIILILVALLARAYSKKNK